MNPAQETIDFNETPSNQESNSLQALCADIQRKSK